MKCERLADSFLDYHAGELPAAEATALREHLKTCLTCQRTWADFQQTLLTLDALPAPAPSERLRENVHRMIEDARLELDAPSPFALARSRLDSFFASLLPSRPALQFAFTIALMAVGVLAGARLLPTAAPAPQVVTQTDPATQQELAALRAKVEAMDRVVSSALESGSANTRLRGVLATLDPTTNADDRALAELLNTLAFDPSVNVRLAALEALYPHATRDAVRTAIVASLAREPSPLVQVAMIDFVVAARDVAAAPALERLVRDANIEKSVRLAAERGLAQL